MLHGWLFSLMLEVLENLLSGCLMLGTVFECIWILGKQVFYDRSLSRMIVLLSRSCRVRSWWKGALYWFLMV